MNLPSPLDMLRRFGLICALLSMAGCGDDAATATEIRIRVESDLSLDEIDHVSIEVTGIVGMESAMADLHVNPLPRTLGVVHGGGPLGPMDVIVTGRLGSDSAPVVSRTATVSFLEGESWLLLIELERACLHMVCPDGTCIEGKCADTEVGPGQTMPGTGGAGAGNDGPDAGPIDIGGDGDSTEGDGLYCTVGEFCIDDVCTDSSPRDCSHLTDMCTQGVCNEADRRCDTVARPDDSPCDDGLFCTENDICRAGTCIAGPPTDCSLGADMCKPATCNEAAARCDIAVAALDTPCAIGTCNAGVCLEEGTCGKDKDCDVTCTDLACDIDCDNANNCEVECAGDANCAVDCSDGNNCTVACSDQATCDISCRGANNCDVSCESGTSCSIDCRDTDACKAVVCADGAECVLDCRGMGDCFFASCTGGAKECPMDNLVCGRDCPE